MDYDEELGLGLGVVLRSGLISSQCQDRVGVRVGQEYDWGNFLVTVGVVVLL